MCFLEWMHLEATATQTHMATLCTGSSRRCFAAARDVVIKAYWSVLCITTNASMVSLWRCIRARCFSTFVLALSFPFGGTGLSSIGFTSILSGRLSGVLSHGKLGQRNQMESNGIISQGSLQGCIQRTHIVCTRSDILDFLGHEAENFRSARRICANVAAWKPIGGSTLRCFSNFSVYNS